MRRGGLALVGAIIVIAGVAWYGIERYRCNRRRAAFARQVESLRQGTHEQLKVGTTKADVARFFTEHSIPLRIEGVYASGSIQTSGCAPFGCGTDSASISVHVRLDRTGSVTEEPTVSAFYTDCL
jgi:hypothetical protein